MVVQSIKLVNIYKDLRDGEWKQDGRVQGHKLNSSYEHTKITTNC